MKNANTLQELVSIARDGAKFYDEAGQEVKDPSLKPLFARMADHKRTLIADLSGTLAANHEDIPTSGTVAGKLRQVYTDVRSSLSSNDAKVYVSQLEETEDRMLEHFEDAVKDVDDAGVRSILQSHLPEVRACHAEMRAAKQRYTA
ncbi:MAG: PA2169 family four-helix-bundle protein [Lysobacteraceae bacterium]